MTELFAAVLTAFTLVLCANVLHAVWVRLPMRPFTRLDRWQQDAADWWLQLRVETAQNPWFYVGICVFCVGGIVFFHPELVAWVR
jgi:hypothetical protein